MATNVVMPALEMAQETGLLVRWLKNEGEQVTKGESLMEIETDKVTVEIEAPASGQLAGVLVHEGDSVPVGRTIAWIVAPGEKVPQASDAPASGRAGVPQQQISPARQSQPSAPAFEVSPVARKMALDQNIDLAQIKPAGKRIEKADILTFMKALPDQAGEPAAVKKNGYRLQPASPKARRLAQERGLEMAALTGSGPEGAVLVADLPAEQQSLSQIEEVISPASTREDVGTIWRVMAERTTASWTSAPHFYLMREVNASRLVEWRKEIAPQIEKQSGLKPTFTDLLVKLIGAALARHSRMLAAWEDGSIRRSERVNVGLAVAVKDGLVVPVIKDADRLTVSQIAVQRSDLVRRANENKLHLVDIEGGVFTLSNLGMYNVDAFMAVINSPQAAILAVGRIADRVMAVDGQPAVRPGMLMTLSCDHRVVDGARGAEFLDELANLIENPWRLIL